jgi:hypothetical protein
MSHVSSIVNSTYPYRGTLSRLDANGDGMLSQGEIAAGQRPGLLSLNSADDSDGSLDASSSPLSTFVAKLLQLPSDGKSDTKTSTLMQPGATSDDTSSEEDTQSPAGLYQATYGQYAMDDIAA